jgi:hypothetical protein
MNSHVQINTYEFICPIISSNMKIFPPLSIKVISMGMTLFPSMARLALAQMNKHKMDPENSTYNSPECEGEKKDQR